jgi:PAS domain-containing protein
MTICIVEDIRRPKQVERLVAARERRLQALIENSSELIALVDATGRLIYIRA